MYTLSLVFEYRDDQGLLTDYQRFDLNTDDALYLAQTMVGDDDWFMAMDHDTHIDLRSRLIGFIDEHIPGTVGDPEK